MNLPNAMSLARHFLIDGETVAIEPTYDPVQDKILCDVVVKASEFMDFEDFERMFDINKKYGTVCRMRDGRLTFR